MEKLLLKLEKFKGVLEVSKVLNSTLELQEVLKRALTIEQQVMGAEAGCLLLLDEAGEELQFVTALGEVCDQLQSAQVKVGKGIAGWVAQNREPLLVADAYADPRFDPSWDKKTGFTTRSLICIPLSSKDQLLGVAQVINRKDGRPFDDDDLELFTVFGGQLATAIANASLHRRLLDQQRLEQELDMARLIQRSFLPAPPPARSELELHAANIPARSVSGDFYDFFKLNDGRQVIVIGDVSGKGVPAALYMANLLNMLRYRVNESSDLGLGLKRLNAQLFTQSQKGMFVTLAVLALDVATGRLDCYRAGHLPPLIIAADGNYRFIGEGGGPPLGVIPDIGFAPEVVQLVPGDRVVLYTDGVTEAEGSASVDLGLEGLAGMLTEQAVPLPVLTARIFAEVDATEGQPALHDDLTVVTCAWRPAAHDCRAFTYRMKFTSDPRFLRVMRMLVEQIGADCELAPDFLTRLKLALDEALTNIMRHSYGGDRHGRIEVSAARTGGKLTFRLRDWGKKADPAMIRSRALDEVRPGGLGVHFIKATMDEVDYDTSQAEGTVLTLVKQLPQGG